MDALKEHILSNNKKKVSMEKINLSEFKENSLAINEMLHTSGGSSDSSGTVHCQTQCNGSDADHKTCDVDW